MSTQLSALGWRNIPAQYRQVAIFASMLLFCELICQITPRTFLATSVMLWETPFIFLNCLLVRRVRDCDSVWHLSISPSCGFVAPWNSWVGGLSAPNVLHEIVLCLICRERQNNGNISKWVWFKKIKTNGPMCFTDTVVISSLAWLSDY